MVRLTIIIALIFGITVIAYSKVVPLKNAIDSGLVSLEAEATGGHEGKTLRLKLQNLKKKKIIILVPSGQRFASSDSLEQDLIVVQERLLALEKGQKRTYLLYANCIQAGNRSPGEHSVFVLENIAEDTLKQLVDFLNENKFKDDEAQYAIWAVTDNKRVENITNSKVAMFTAKLLGKPAPNYIIHHAPGARNTGQAFVPNPALIEGMFKFYCPNDRMTTFGLYDETGEIVLEVFKNKKQLKGQHRFKFNFEISHLDSGNYYARMTDGSDVLQELVVAF